MMYMSYNNSNMSNLNILPEQNSGSRKDMRVGNFTSTLFNTNVYDIIYNKESLAGEQLSEVVEKILNDIDSGNVRMVTQTAAEFIADMNKDLAETDK
jgi:hypothetical protein